MTQIKNWSLEDVRNVTETRKAFEDDDLDRPTLAWWTNEHGDRVEYRLNTANLNHEETTEVIEIDVDDGEVDETEIDSYLNDLEEMIGYPIADATETDREEKEDVVEVTLDVKFEVPKYQSAAYIPEAAAEEMGLEQLDRAEYDLAADGYIIGEFDAREPSRRACVNFLNEEASDEQLGYTEEDEETDSSDDDSDEPQESEDDPEIPRSVIADRLSERNTKAELVEKAEAEGIEVAKRWTKDEMIEAILDDKEDEMRDQMAAQ